MFDIRKYKQIMIIQLFFKIRITTKNNFCEILFSKEKIWSLIFTFCHSANHKNDQQKHHISARRHSSKKEGHLFSKAFAHPKNLITTLERLVKGI